MGSDVPSLGRSPPERQQRVLCAQRCCEGHGHWEQPLTGSLNSGCSPLTEYAPPRRAGGFSLPAVPGDAHAPAPGLPCTAKGTWQMWPVSSLELGDDPGYPGGPGVSTGPPRRGRGGGRQSRSGRRQQKRQERLAVCRGLTRASGLESGGPWPLGVAAKEAGPQPCTCRSRVPPTTPKRQENGFPRSAGRHTAQLGGHWRRAEPPTLCRPTAARQRPRSRSRGRALRPHRSSTGAGRPARLPEPGCAIISHSLWAERGPDGGASKRPSLLGSGPKYSAGYEYTC